MKAIRLGAMLQPQGFGDLRDDEGGLCAWGAAYLAIGKLQESIDLPCDDSDAADYERWPVSAVKAACPECGIVDELGYVIGGCLNDEHRWTRERIADWVETVEDAQEAQQRTDVRGEVTA